MFRVVFAVVVVLTIRYAWLKKQEHDMKEEDNLLTIHCLGEGIHKREKELSELRMTVKVLNVQKKFLTQELDDMIGERNYWCKKFLEAELKE